MGVNCPSCLHTIAFDQTDIHQDQIWAARLSQFECLTRSHGNANYRVSGCFQVSLRVQGDKRFIFDYENSHDMVEPIRLAKEVFMIVGRS